MPETGAQEASRPKKHSSFMQVVYRKSGETLDLTGKALVALSGVGAVLKGDLTHAHWALLLIAMAGGGAAVGVGIYLQAKAEETFE